MKILCICQKGNSRSVVMAWVLRNLHGHETLALGMKTSTPATREMLYEWAEMIVLLAPQYRSMIPDEHGAKVEVCNVGHDTYFKPHNSALLDLCREFAEKHGLSK